MFQPAGVGRRQPRRRSPTRRAPTSARSIGPDGQVRDRHAQPGRPAGAHRRRAGASPTPAACRRTVELNHTRVVIRGVPVKLAATPTSPAGYGALVGRAWTPRASRPPDTSCARSCCSGSAGIVPLAGLLAWLLAGRALRTVSELTEEAEAVGLSDIGRGLDVAAGDPELRRLVAALDRMLARVAAEPRARAPVRRRRQPPAAYPVGDPAGRGRAGPARGRPAEHARGAAPGHRRRRRPRASWSPGCWRRTRHGVPRRFRSATRCRPPASGGSARSWPAGRGWRSTSTG